ncbi:MAG TPA: hypothetical protein VKA85_11935 [Candidatus Limnocylindrales bacterium]|nr:hypothetical protein [Candidatus Limnocylindrales bacterium]
MPRAKRTDRADARRRYRAQVATDVVEPGEDDGDSASPAATSARGGRARGATPAAAPARSGIGYAFRAAFHPANLREDLAHLPILIRSRAVLLPLLAIAATAIALTASGGHDVVSALLAQYFLFPPPIGAIFIAGFFAPRASYLAGGIVGVAAAIGVTAAAFTIPPGSLTTTTGPGAGQSAAPSAIVSPAPSAAASGSGAASPAVSLSPSRAASASPAAASGAASPGASAGPGASAAPSPSATPAASPEQVAAYSFLISPVAGIFFASAAAWYRRFLRLANPNRGVQRSSNNRGRQQQRRR